MEAFIGTVNFVAFNYAPVGWALCHGQSMPISQNQPLFALIGTVWGGDGNTTFNLPDLRGRSPMGIGQGPGLTERKIGQTGGAESFHFTAANIPPHSHGIVVTKPVEVTVKHTVQSLPANDHALTATPPTDSLVTGTGGVLRIFAPANASGGTHYPINDIEVKVEQPAMRIEPYGSGSASVAHQSPFAVLPAIICLSGEFPTRN